MLDLPEYQALQALAYEGTPDEVALNFKVSRFWSLLKEPRLRSPEQSAHEGKQERF